jgi:hypothetical protein
MDRSKVALAKLAEEIADDTPNESFPGILLMPRPTREDDQFVEVHIWGPMSIRTFSHASIERKGQSKAILRALRYRLEGQGLSVDER